MIYILDTDTTIYWLKGNKNIERKIIEVGLPNVGITILTCCELYYGAYKSKKVDENLMVIEKLKQKIQVIHTSNEVDRNYGRIKATLESSGTPLDDSDMLIASITIANKGILVTNNIKHFNRIEGLTIENWSR
ncbi:MAG: type II toxin-antitoxin system VapC family toxin [Nitrospirota bacterium]